MRSEREALLRPEYAELYPGLMPGVWESAAVVADRVVASILGPGRFITPGERALDPEHFEFRGSDIRPPASRPRRREDL